MPRVRDNKNTQSDGVLPLSGVIDVLKRAAERGELSVNELDWSIARLSGKVRAGNPRLEGIDRRDSILRAAIEIFRRDGYNRAGIETIANELFVSKAAVYHYFSSKQEILDAICERSSIATYDGVMAAREGTGDPDPRLRSMLTGYARACMNEPGFSILMRHFEEVSDVEREKVQRRGKEVETAFRETVAEGVAVGAFSPPDARITVFGMLGSLNYMYAWFKPEGRLSPEQVADALVTFIVDGVRGDRARSPQRARKAPASGRRTAKSHPR